MERPNIILITTDEQRWDTLGCYGNQKVKTPTLDALAAKGTLFAKAYNQNPVCIPARACLQTGRYTRQHGVSYMEAAVDSTPGLPPWERTFMEHLQDAGYVTAAFGKIHMMPPKGYHETQLTGGKGSRWTQSYGSPLGPGPLGPVYARWLDSVHPGGYELIYEQRREPEYRKYMTAISNVLPIEEYIDTWITENTREFVSRDHDRPFFAWCGICGPHGPFDPPRPYDSMYPSEYVDVSPTYLADDSDKPKHLQNGGGRFAKLPDDSLIRRVTAFYWGLCTYIDDMMERLFQTLEECGKTDNTLIIFTSDHGDHMGDWSRGGKGTFWEGSARVPFIVVPPAGMPRVSDVEGVIGTFQVAPTILEYAGVEIPKEMQATSLKPVVEGTEDAPGFALCEFEDNNQVVRGKSITTNRYKYAFWNTEDGQEFYDMEEDPLETRNLARDPGARDLVRQHGDMLLQHLLDSEKPIRRW
ncbi:MAG: sulfatase-like hydrolase/transferase [Chloroflexota bacterium]|nr:sulfatase-like hydrolase/transferase [Chloroflexota bacterium]MDE2841186.1 sulfatase-like hydrolase/transferase [Chloroflexota bacterium]MDE2929340.1 sulfatase-like hydrolase/transferase [Chloroflexota bacterium]